MAGYPLTRPVDREQLSRWFKLPQTVVAFESAQKDILELFRRSIGDAPSDGTIYGRQDGAWVAVPIAPPPAPPAPQAAPGGPNFAVQFNNGNTFDGSSAFTFNPLTRRVVFGAGTTVNVQSGIGVSDADTFALVGSGDIANLQIRPTTGKVSAALTLRNRDVSVASAFIYSGLQGDDQGLTILSYPQSGWSGRNSINFAFQPGTYTTSLVEGGQWIFNHNTFNSLPTPTGYGVEFRGTVNYASSSRIFLSGSAGSAGQVLTSQGAGNAPTWSAAGVSDGDKGDITVSGGGATWAIDAQAVTYAKIQNVTDARLLGRSAGSAGSVQEITIGAGLSLSGGVLSNSGSGQASVQFQDEGTNLGAAGTVDVVNFVGAGVSAARVGNTVTVTISGGGGGSPGGSSTQVQYNNAGAFGGIANVTSNGTDFTAVGIAGDITFAGTGRRITGDMSNATFSNRLSFQSSTTNGNTNFNIIPNGTATSTGFSMWASSTYATASKVQQCALVPGTGALWDSILFNVGSGSGDGEPHRWRVHNNTSGVINALHLHPSGNMNVGPTMTDPGVRFQVEGNLNVSGVSRFIRGDFSDATVANRTLIQSNVTNGQTAVVFAPNGTGTTVGFSMYGASSVTNCAVIQFALIPSSSLAVFDCITVGSGTAVPLRFRMGASVVNTMEFSTAGAVSFASIGTTASAANAFLDSAASNNLLRSTSSRRYKQDIKDVDDSSIVLKLRPITYRSRAAADDPKRRHYGFIAEEVAEITPMLVHFDAEGRPDGMQYERVVPLLVAKVQEFERRLSSLELH
jgi:hypothetical protein